MAVLSGRLWQARQNIGIPVTAARSVPEGEVKRGEVLDNGLGLKGPLFLQYFPSP